MFLGDSRVRLVWKKLKELKKKKFSFNKELRLNNCKLRLKVQIFSLRNEGDFFKKSNLFQKINTGLLINNKLSFKNDEILRRRGCW
jgi:hypothetical protein